MRNIYVSIHAPAGGATAYKPSPLWLLRMFQSTRPRGARLAGSGPDRASNRCFNPRARGGRDAESQAELQMLRKFQSTRPRGARPLAPLYPPM